MISKFLKRFIFLISFILLQGCIEPFDYESQYYEEVLVLEATITDELKVQEVFLSRSFVLGTEGPERETGAEVTIDDDAGNTFSFSEAEPGIYLSDQPFQALPDRNYQLEILTADGSRYESDPAPLSESSEIDDLYARRTTQNGEEGIALQVNNYNSEDASRYYRYRYEETYKIISRFSHDKDLVYENGAFVEVLKTREETTCYNTVASNDIILGNTTALDQNDLEDFLVRFIPYTNPVISRRYSILVKQYAISPEAYAYYETQRKLSGSDNVFSQNQPGFIAGNIFNPDDPEEKVVGMFNVSSVSSQRIYFNFRDFFGPEISRPHFTKNCDIGAPSISPAPRADNLISLLEMGVVKYLGPSGMSGEDVGPYNVVNAACVDCTLLGTNVVPEFWEEE